MIEDLIVMPMLLVLSTGLTLTLTNMMQVTDKTQEETTLQTEARATFNTLTSDIRQSFVGDGTDSILSASATSIMFFSPDRYPTKTVGTTQSSFHLRQITYTLTNGVLNLVHDVHERLPDSSAVDVAGRERRPPLVLDSITNTDVFSYYTAAGAQTSPATPLAFPISDTTGIRAVGIKLALSTGGTQPKTFTETAMIALRETDS